MNNNSWKIARILTTTMISAAVFSLVALAASVVAAEQGSPDVPLTGQGLWVTSEVCNSFFTEFQGKSLTTSGEPKPTLKPVVSLEGKIGTVKFDAQQNAFITFCDAPNGFVLGLPPSAIHALKTRHPKKVIPNVTIQDSSLDCPRDLAFDRSGNLWVLSSGLLQGTPKLAEYSALSLARGGSPSPEKIVTAPEINLPSAIRFDSTGNLWMADSFTDEVYEFTADQLATETATSPNIILRSHPPPDNPFVFAYGYPTDLIFDGAGNMWVAYSSGGTETAGGLEKFAASDLTGSGTILPNPLEKIDTTTGANPSLYDPSGLAFDSSGNLWVSNAADGFSSPIGKSHIVEFTAAQLDRSGIVAPNIRLESNLKGDKCRPSLNFVQSGLITFGPLVR